jgi:ABC-type sugar transport systems, permease components
MSNSLLQEQRANEFAWWRLERKIFPYLGIAMFFVLFMVFTLYPFVFSLVLSTHKTTMMTSTFVGLRNFWLIFVRNDGYRIALLNGFVFALLSALTQIPAALVLAFIFNNKLIKFNNFFRTIYFMPMVVSGAVIATMASIVFNQQVGLVNQLAGVLHLPNNTLWLYDASFTMLLLLLIASWRYTGFHMVIFLAGLQGIDSNLYEAARIDGASEGQILRLITVPNLKPIISFSLINSLSGSFQFFDLPRILYPQGGPQNSGYFPLTWIFRRGFNDFELGEASAAGWILFLIIVTLTVVYYKILRVGHED